LRASRSVRACPALVAFLVVISISKPSWARRFLSREEALARKNMTVVKGERSRQRRTCAADDQTFDIRRLSSTGNFGDLSNLSVGNDCGSARTDDPDRRDRQGKAAATRARGRT
jgi:hypothetical protein